MLYFETIDSQTLDLLKQIHSNPHFSGTRLVGGTALALQIGHRKSIDLDFFGHTDLTPIEMAHELQVYGPVVTRSSSQRIQRYLVGGIQLDLVEYDYPWLDNPISDGKIRLASIRDIAAMKLSAITNRGTKKDFVDLVFLMQRFTLQEMLDFYSEKFKDGSTFMVLKSLVFFDDAEDDPVPDMNTPFNWKNAKQQITKAVSAIIAN